MGTAESLVIHSDAEILGGTPVFVGTRVPFQALIDYLEAGQSLDEFLEDFPTVSRERIGIIWRKQLAIRAKGRDVIAAEAGCQLRETETANQGLFEGQKGGLSLENTFFWNRSLHPKMS